jgi:hypothetical protein
MIENVHPAVIFGVVAAAVLAARYFLGRKAAKQLTDAVVVIAPKPIADVLMRIIGIFSDLGIEPVVGDIQRALVEGDMSKAADKAQATIDALNTPGGNHALMQLAFDRQLASRLADPEQRAKISAKVEQYK